MSTIRAFSIFDQLKFSNVNLDCLTETFYTRFYSEYLIKWQDYCVASTNSLGTIEGYHLGKVEGDRCCAHKKEWHGHVSAVTVAPDFRRQGLARSLMDICEEVTEKHDGWFVDLFVRAGNTVAVRMYEKLGYVVY